MTRATMFSRCIDQRKPLRSTDGDHTLRQWVTITISRDLLSETECKEYHRLATGNFVRSVTKCRGRIVILTLRKGSFYLVDNAKNYEIKKDKNSPLYLNNIINYHTSVLVYYNGQNCYSNEFFYKYFLNDCQFSEQRNRTRTEFQSFFLYIFSR